MPDPMLILQAILIAIGIGASVTGLAAGVVSRYGLAPGWSSAAATLALGLAFTAGCIWLGIKPHWPPREDQDRLLELVLPAIVLVELLSAWSRVPPWLINGLRLAVASLTARVLLHGTSYLDDLSGPGTREWTPMHAGMILFGLALALVGSWFSLVRLIHRSPTASPVLALAGVILAAALTIMLSGYATGGQVGLPLAAGLLGVAIPSLVLPIESRPRPPVGVAIVALFSLLVIGRFFGQLSTAHAILLLSAPLLAWVPELPYLVRFPNWARGLSRLGIVAALAVAVLFDAQRQFAVASSSGARPEATGASAQDYMNLGH